MNVTHTNIKMFQMYKFILLVSLLLIIKGLHVEITFIDKNPSMNSKILCIPSSENLDIGKKDKILWHGTQLGKYDRQKLSKNFGMDLLITNVSINASNKDQCYLVAPMALLENLEEKKLGILKTRLTRDGEIASIPMVEKGNCPPGHRIAEDRCFPCFPGSYTSGQQYDCFLCPKDFYMDKQAADFCWPCPQGTNTLAQGADSVASCVYLNGTGHAQIKQNPPWILIYILIGVILLIIWILIIYLLIRYWNRMAKMGKDEGTFFKRKETKKDRPSHVYESINDIDKEEPVYVEIDDYENDYEEPKIPVPILPPRRKDSRTSSTYKTFSEEQYEIPISRSDQKKRRSEEHYEVPIERRSYSQYADPSERSLDDEYEIPIRTQPIHSYSEFLDDSEDHMYSEISSEDETNQGGNENKLSSSSSMPYVPGRFKDVRKYSSDNHMQRRKQ